MMRRRLLVRVGLSFVATLLSLPLAAKTPQVPSAPQWATRMGLTLGAGVEVRSVKKFSFANVIAPQCRGMQKGDRIVAVNGSPVQSKAQFERITQWYANRNVQMWSFTVERKGRTFMAEPPQDYACDPLTLIGCGPSPERHVKYGRCRDLQGRYL